MAPNDGLINASGLQPLVISNLATNNSGGELGVDDAAKLNLVSPLANNGAVMLRGATAVLSGAAITNSGTISGLGRITNAITNNGTLEAAGGTLTLVSAVSNTASGLISVDSGSKLLVSSGLSSQTGIVDLNGGTFDNNNRALVNAGLITGFGTLRTGGAGLTNNGSMTLSGGFSTINGAVTNNASHQIRVAYSPALFTGNVTNHGTFKNTSTTITFAGTYTEAGTFISDPAENYFMDAYLTPSGTWTGSGVNNFYVKGTLNWTGGSMTGAGGTTFAQGTSLLSGSDNKTLNAWVFNNQTALAMTGTGNLVMGNGAALNNSSTFDVQSDVSLVNTLGGTATFTNSSIFRKSGGSGTTNVGPGITFANNIGSIDVQSGTVALQGELTTAAGSTLTKSGGGTLSISGPQSHGVGAVLTATGGITNMSSDAGGAIGVERLTVNANAAVNVTGTQHLTALHIGPGNTVTLTRPANAPQQTLVTGALAMSSTSDLDLKDNAMVVHGGGDPTGTFLAIEASIASAFDNANLDGHGIKSSSVQDPFATGLGSALNSLLAATFAPLDSLNGQALALSDTIVKYTYMGDATLDGVVNDDDASLIGGYYDNGATGGHHWFEGDFTHDGLINDDDVSILSGNYSPNEPPFSARMIQSRYGANFAAAFERGLAAQAVPEPSTMALGGFGLAGLLALALRRSSKRRAVRGIMQTAAASSIGHSA